MRCLTGLPARTALIRSLHAAAHELGLNEDAYRDRLERATGQRSCRDLSDDQIAAALKDFRRDSHLHPHAAKARALWIGLYNLGAVEGSDKALDAFARRQTGADKLAFVAALDARRLTEALKAMAAREGWDIPSDDSGGMRARVNLVLAQWKKLHAIGAVRIADAGASALMWWARNQGIIRASAHPTQWKRHELDAAAKALGQWIRQALARGSAAAK